MKGVKKPVFSGVVLFMMVCLFSGRSFGDDGVRTIVVRINSTEISLDRDIRVDITGYEELAIDGIKAAHVRKKTKEGLFNKLYISGKVVPLKDVMITEMKVKAEFYNGKGDLVAKSEAGVTPRVLGVRNFRRGRFTVSTDYDPAVTGCKLSLTWYKGPREEE
jgi:hypothetical protein